MAYLAPLAVFFVARWYYDASAFESAAGAFAVYVALELSAIQKSVTEILDALARRAPPDDY